MFEHGDQVYHRGLVYTFLRFDKALAVLTDDEGYTFEVPANQVWMA